MIRCFSNVSLCSWIAWLPVTRSLESKKHWHDGDSKDLSILLSCVSPICSFATPAFNTRVWAEQCPLLQNVRFQKLAGHFRHSEQFRNIWKQYCELNLDPTFQQSIHCTPNLWSPVCFYSVSLLRLPNKQDKRSQLLSCFSESQWWSVKK